MPPAHRTITVDVDDWEHLCRVFRRFFTPVGTVTEESGVISFVSDDPGVDTGLSLTADGRTAAFMPLHGLEATWSRVTFDDAAAEVVLESRDVTYVYRVPASLRGIAAQGAGGPAHGTGID